MSRLCFMGWQAEVAPGENGAYRVVLEDRSETARLLAWENGLLSFIVKNRVVSAAVEVFSDRVEVILGGRRVVFAREEAGRVEGAAGARPGLVRAELPGKVLEVSVAEGDIVGAGQVLVVIEAMKMEHPLRAGVAARVARIQVWPGAQISTGDLLLELEDLT